jgi:nicotinate (nicotinamide) nucleotide adenylyltransferase
VRPIGILGGTFDPVHFGHLRAALDLLEELNLAQVRLVPARIPPHRVQPAASAGQRLAMLEAAIRHESRLVIDDRELHRDGPSYMVDTLQSLRAEVGGIALALIVGADAFSSLPIWHRWREIVELSHVIVMQRPGGWIFASDELNALLAERLTQEPLALINHPAGCILEWAVTQLDISASRIRELVHAGRSPRYLLPDPVWEIIQKEGLYGG